MFQSYPMHLSIWALPKSLCPLISFTLPNLDSFTLSITASKLNEPFCVVTNSYNFSHNYYFGIFSNYSSSNYKIFSQYELSPYDVCQDTFCKTLLNGSVLFWFENPKNIALQTFIQNRLNANFEPKQTESSFEISPLPYYNYTEKYIVGEDFDKVIIKSIRDDLSLRKHMTYVMLFAASLLGVFFLILKLIDVLLLYCKSKRNAGPISYDSTNAQPITLVLNQYCPNTSAKIVVPNI